MSRAGLGIWAVRCHVRYAGAEVAQTLKTIAPGGDQAVERARRWVRRRGYVWVRLVSVEQITEADF